MAGEADPAAVDGGGSAAASDGPPAAGRMPDFFIVGHKKSGTTALFQMLDRHPQIFTAAVKEPRYFATDMRSVLGARTGEPNPLHTLEGYTALFAPAAPGQLAGEASPEYLRSREAASGIAAANPDARIIAILREPASFLRSFHMQMVSSEVENERDLRTALSLQDERLQGRRLPPGCHHPKSLQYYDHVRYVEQLRRFHDLFPAEQVLVLIYDDYRADNAGTIDRVLRFLGVDGSVAIETHDTKPLKEVRSMRLHHMANELRRARTNPQAALPLARAANALIPSRLLNDGVRGAWRRVAYSAPQAPDEQLMLELRRRFRGEVEAVSEYLGRDLVAQWGYSELG